MKRFSASSIAKANLKHRRKKYTLLIIGIILSMIFSSGMIFFISSYQASALEAAKRKYGTHDFYVIASSGVKEKLKAVSDDCCSAYITDYLYLEDENKPYGFAAARYSDEAMDMYYHKLIEGKMPEKPGEIAVEKSALTVLDLEKSSPGDKISFISAIPDGNKLSDRTEERTYILTGILEDKRVNTGIINNTNMLLPAAVVSDKEKVLPGGLEIEVSFGNFIKDCDIGIFSEAVRSEGVYDHSLSVNRAEEYAKNLSNMTGNIVFYIILMCVLMSVMSGAGIVNAFTSDLKERKSRIGMLRAVGATKRQIISIFGRETFFISLICVPVSTIISFFAVKIIISHLGSSYIFTPDIKVLLLSIAVSLIFVVLASLIPLKEASGVSPVQAVRNIEIARKMRKKKIKTEKTFNVSSLFSKRSLVFSGAGSRAVSLILLFTVALSGTGFSISLSYYENAGIATADYSLKTFPSLTTAINVNYESDQTGFTESELSGVISNRWLSRGDGRKNCRVNILKDSFTPYELLVGAGLYHQFYARPQGRLTAGNYKEKAMTDFEPDYIFLKNEAGYEKDYLPMTVTALTPGLFSQLNNYLYEGKIDIGKINSGEEIIVCAPEKLGLTIGKYNSDDYYLEVEAFSEDRSKKYVEVQDNTFLTGDILEMSVLKAESHREELSAENKKVKIGAVLRAPDGEISELLDDHFRSPVNLITTLAGMENFLPGATYDSMDFYLKSAPDDVSDESVMNTLDKIVHKNSMAYASSKYADEKALKERLMSEMFMLAALIIIFFTVCVSIINNSVTSRITEEKRAIGTLRAVGADARDIIMCYAKQLLTVFLRGFGAGIILNILIVSGLNIYNRIENNGIHYKYILIPGIAASALLFIICAVNLAVKIKKETKNSIVENIREL